MTENNNTQYIKEPTQNKTAQNSSGTTNKNKTAQNNTSLITQENNATLESSTQNNLNNITENKNSQSSLQNNTNRILQDPALKILAIPLLGMLFLCFIAQTLNLFVPINSFVSITILVLGIAFSIYFCKSYFKDSKILISGLLALILSAPLGFVDDRVGDSMNYHLQIVTWIEHSPVIFGLGNIHGRLGFNGIIYNFHALTDTSQIVPSLRSFIANELVFFIYFFGAFYTFLRVQKFKIYHLFILCAFLPMLYFTKAGMSRGLYCEGMGSVFGVIVFSFLIKIIEEKDSKNAAIFTLVFILALFATLVKIANFGLILAVILCYFYMNYKNLGIIFSKAYLKIYAYLGIFSFIVILPWALKGIMTTGMIAYPASIGFIESLPWAVSEQQRAGEVCWVMSWARAPHINCEEVMNSHAWLKEWFLMRVEYFDYFKYYVYAFFACVALFLALRIYIRFYDKSSIDIRIFYASFCLIFVGILYWFFAGPDPRFGLVYIVPLLALFFAFNIAQIRALKRYKAVFMVLLILSVIPLFRISGRAALIFIWLFFILYGNKGGRAFISFFVILNLLGICHFYRKNVKSFRETKFSHIFVEEKITDYGVKIYVRHDKPTQNTYKTYNEDMPMTPYYNPKIKEESILGRKAYINMGK